MDDCPAGVSSLPVVRWAGNSALLPARLALPLVYAVFVRQIARVAFLWQIMTPGMAEWLACVSGLSDGLSDGMVFARPYSLIVICSGR